MATELERVFFGEVHDVTTIFWRCASGYSIATPKSFVFTAVSRGINQAKLTGRPDTKCTESSHFVVLVVYFIKPVKIKKMPTSPPAKNVELHVLADAILRHPALFNHSVIVVWRRSEQDVVTARPWDKSLHSFRR